jgi:taurine---2-oxoglutarate transaminase
MTQQTDVLSEMHKKHVLTPWIAQGGFQAPVIVRAEGRYLYDSEGKRYFDLASGLIAVNLGHGHPRVVAAIQQQAASLCYAPPSMFNDARAELAKELSDISPWKGEGCRTFFTTGGAEANDDVVRMVRHLTGRDKIMTAYRSYHGSTGTSIALTGEDRRWGGEHGGSAVVRFFAPFPYRSPFFTENAAEECARALEHVERTLVHENPKRVAALLIETVVGSNGVIVYPEGYLQGLRKICDRHGILLVLDEVMTGFGRTGAAFACEKVGVVPDIITFAKGVTSAYLPLGGMMVRESLAKTFDSKAMPNGHTYSGHPLVVASALATVRAYRDEALYARANEIESWIVPALRALSDKHGIIGDVRGIGAFYAVEFVKDKKSKEPLVPWHNEGGMGLMKNLYGELRSRGVYTFGKFNVTMVAPPLTTEKAEFDQAMQAFDQAVTAFAATLG